MGKKAGADDGSSPVERHTLPPASGGETGATDAGWQNRAALNIKPNLSLPRITRHHGVMTLAHVRAPNKALTSRPARVTLCACVPY